MRGAAERLRWTEDACDPHPDDEPSHHREAEYLTLARVRIAQERLNPASQGLSETLGLLDRLLAAAESSARRDSMIRVLILRALALDVEHNEQEALDALALRSYLPSGMAMCASS